MFGAGSDAFVDRDRAFWASMHRDVPGVWRVEVAGQVRELRARFTEAEDAFVRDPVWYGWNAYGVRLVADDPFWRGPWVTRQFENDITPAPFFGGVAGGSGPPFHITSSSQLSSSRISNPGDEPSYLVYLLHGPFTDASVGLGDGPAVVTEYLQPVADGDTVVIDTRPDRSATARVIPTPTAALGTVEWEAQVFGVEGSNAFAALGEVALRSPLQPGQQRALAIEMTGPGRVTVAHRPPYQRAW
ncbi:MAG: hypothetical protein WBH03_21350 [Cyclobacteriaceae bacterium]